MFEASNKVISNIHMCSRFSLYSTYPRLAHRIGELRVDDPPAPRYNVAPGRRLVSTAS